MFPMFYRDVCMIISDGIDMVIDYDPLGGDNEMVRRMRYKEYLKIYEEVHGNSRCLCIVKS